MNMLLNAMTHTCSACTLLYRAQIGVQLNTRPLDGAALRANRTMQEQTLGEVFEISHHLWKRSTRPKECLQMGQLLRQPAGADVEIYHRIRYTIIKYTMYYKLNYSIL